MYSNTMETLDSMRHFGTYKKSHPSSFLISFEGIEGAGKTTQIEHISDYLISNGRKVSRFREPGGTKVGEALRAAILNSDKKLNPLTEAHIFCAARTELLSKEILPLLEKPNQVVILDRFIDSSLAYQGIARNLGFETILELHKHFPLNTLPHKTFYLEIDQETSMQRQGKRGNTKDYFEKENQAFYAKLIHGFELCSKYFPTRICRIDATLGIDEISKSILSEMSGLLNG